MLPNFQWYCFPLCSPHSFLPDTLTREGVPFRQELRYWDVPSKSWVPLQGGSPALGLQASRSDTWIHPPKHRQSPDKGSSKEARQRHGRGQESLASLLAPMPHPFPFPSLDPPILHQGLANGGVGEHSSPPPPSHTHSPFFLKSPRSAGRWRPRNTTMTAGATQTTPIPTAPDRQATPAPQPSTEGCGSASPPSCRARSQAGEGLGSRSSSHLRRLHPSADPAPQGEYGGRNPLRLAGNLMA